MPISRPLAVIASTVAILLTLYHMTVAIIGPPVTEAHRAIHFMLGTGLLFLASAAARRPDETARQVSDLALAVAIGVPCLYVILFSRYVTHRMLYVTPLTTTELILGCIVVAAAFVAARRSLGWPMVIVGGVFLAYTQLGPYLPFPFWHRGYSPAEVIEHLYLSLDGLWGTPIGASANYIFLFVLFGALLVASGAGTFFSDFANAVAGRFVGGPAKTAVLSSALMSMLSGSSTANVVTTGSFTIPAMKSYGYRKEFAAGVEALASTGGLITPPVMGAAAFIMADFLGVSYARIMAAAAIPAALYFVAILVAVDLEARSRGLGPQPHTDPRPLVEILRGGLFMMVPLAAIIWFLVDGYTPAVAGFYGVLAFLVSMPLLSRRPVRELGSVVFEAAVEAPRMMAPIIVACAVGGVIAGIVSLTGLGVRVTSIIGLLSGGSALLFLALTMLVAIVLGMGMPTSAVYIVLAAVLAPGMIGLGFEPLAAHMFIFFGAVMSNITPPLAIASFAAAAVAGADPWKTSLDAVRLAAGVFLLPFVFVYSPALLGSGDALSILHASGTAVLGMACLSVAAVGWFTAPLAWWLRILIAGAAVLLIVPGWVSDAIGGGVVLAGTVAVIMRRKDRQEASSEETE